jgi:hypothetical protein
MRFSLLLMITALVALAFSVPAASAATGDLTFSSCQSNAAITGQSCTVQTGLLDAVVSVQVSPDGKNAYAVATSSNALIVFDRNTTTGALTIKSGASGCFANATTGSCTVLTGQLSKPEALTISPDGKNVYVVASTGGTLLTFDRDTTTGALTQKASPFGCHSNSVLGTCIVVTNQLYGVGAVSVSPDGKSVYTVSTISVSDDSGVVTTFTRDPLNGVLESTSCVSSVAVASCVVPSDQFNLITAASSRLVVSPDGRNAYLNARSTQALLIFDRNLTTGVLTRKVGATGCISNAVSGTCTVVAGYLPSPISMSISSDGANVYVNSGGTIDAIDTVTTFSRNASTGVLAKLAGADGCLASAALNDCTVLNPAAQPAQNFDSRNVAISPDGLSAYITSYNWNMLLAFDRSTTTGALKLKSGAAGCFSNSAMSPCTTTTGLLFAANPVTLSPDGLNVYTGAGTSTDPNISVFTRSRPPVALAVSPAKGTTAGGTSVVITGTNLDGTTQVTFGGTASKITATTPTSLTVTTPLHIAGKVAVKVTTPHGASTLAGAYTYAVPAIKAIIVAAKPTVAYSKRTITFRTIVTINAAGTINQVFSRMVKGKRVAVCTRKKTITRAGKYPIICVAGLATRNVVKRGRTSFRVLTSFNASGTAAVSSVQNLVLARKR